MATTANGLTRVIIDPNNYSHLMLSVASFDDAERPVVEGETVLGVQPEDNSEDPFAADFSGPAIVHSINHKVGLIYLSVSWDKWS